MHNRLSKILGFSITVVVVFEFILKDIPNYFYFDVVVKDILVNLSLSYIAAYIFYLIQVWLPQQKIKAQVNELLSIALSKVFKSFHDLFNELDNEIINANDSESVKSLIKNKTKSLLLSQKLTKSIEYLDIKTGRRKYKNYLAFIKIQHDNIINYINHIETIRDTDQELNLILFKIKTSNLMASQKAYTYLVDLGVEQQANEIVKIENSLFEFYCLLKELEDYAIKNNISIMIFEEPKESDFVNVN